MKSKKEILRILKKNKKKLEHLGVTQIGLFGSYVYSEQTEKSDIDLLIDFAPEKENFSNFLEANQLLENLFKYQKIDVVTRNGLSPYIGPHILKNVEYA